MSMQFRYKLAKETYKGKKVPPKDDLNEDHISVDQRGNKNFANKLRTKPDKKTNVKKRREENLLGLDKKTITEPETEREDREVSRRDLFNIFNPAAYASEAQKDKKPRKRKKRKKKKSDIDPNLEINPTPDYPSEGTLNKSINVLPKTKDPDNSKPSVIGRFWIWLKLPFVKSARPPTQESNVQEATDINSTASGTITLKSSESVEPTEPEISVRVVQTEDDLISEKIIAQTNTKSTKLREEEDKDEEFDPDDPEVNRRNLMRQGLHFFAKPAVENISEKIETVNHSINKITKRKAMIRPPGAVTEKQFLQACTRCDACIHSCPKDAIKRAPKSHGFLVMGTPFIEPIKNPCVMCNDLPCISACEDGALKPVRDIFEVTMGYAILDKKHCKAFSNSPCQQCVIDCPVPGAITQNKELQPEFHKNICTGCGVCVRSCHTVNTPVAIKIKPQMVIDNQLLKKKLEQEKQEINNSQMAEQAAATAQAAAEAAAKFFSSDDDKDNESDDSR